MRVAAVTAACALAATGCSGDSSPSSTDAQTVVATTSIWADITGNVACDGSVIVETLIPSGADAHSFQPSLADRALLDDASLIISNGLGLEEIMADTLDAAERAGTPIIEIADHVQTQTSVEETDDGDPHIWFDPRLVADSLDVIADGLIDETGADPDALAKCVEDYRSELKTLDEETEALIDTLSANERSLATDHESLTYFAQRYGLDIVGTVIPSASTLAESNPAQLEALARTLEQEGVRVIFAEGEHSTEEADVLSRRLGDVRVVTLHTAGLEEHGSEADTYLNLIRTNAAEIVAGLTDTP